MKAVIRYIANDGSEWDTADAATERDELKHRVDRLEVEMGPRVDRGRRAVNPERVASVKERVVQICRELWPNEPVFQNEAMDISPFSYAGRFLSDVGGPLNSIWWRFSCINGAWEYEQPYFALHPEQFKEEKPA